MGIIFALVTGPRGVFFPSGGALWKKNNPSGQFPAAGKKKPLYTPSGEITIFVVLKILSLFYLVPLIYCFNKTSRLSAFFKMSDRSQEFSTFVGIAARSIKSGGASLGNNITYIGRSSCSRR